MSGEVTLTTTMRSTLYSLQGTAALVASVQGRLSSGKTASAALDNPNNYFSSQALSNRANDISALLDGMGQAIQAIKQAVQGVSAAQQIVDQMTVTAGAAQQALSDEGGGEGATLSSQAEQYDSLRDDLDQTVAAASYQGINLISGTDNPALTVTFDDKGGSAASLTIAAVDLTASGLGLSAAVGSWNGSSDVAASRAALAAASATLRQQAQSLDANLTTVQTRQDFATNMINTLKEGADNLTLADMNEESANMLALQTRQQLGVQSLSLASQANQAVMRLFS